MNNAFLFGFIVEQIIDAFYAPVYELAGVCADWDVEEKSMLACDVAASELPSLSPIC